jgi:hypothetical protein
MNMLLFVLLALASGAILAMWAKLSERRSEHLLERHQTLKGLLSRVAALEERQGIVTPYRGPQWGPAEISTKEPKPGDVLVWAQLPGDGLKSLEEIGEKLRSEGIVPATKEDIQELLEEIREEQKELGARVERVQIGDSDAYITKPVNREERFRQKLASERVVVVQRGSEPGRTRS